MTVTHGGRSPRRWLLRRLAHHRDGGPCPCCGHEAAPAPGAVPVRIELDCDRVRADLRAAAWATGLPHFAGAGQDVTAWIDAATEAELQLMDSLCHLARVVRLHEWAALTGGAEVLER